MSGALEAVLPRRCPVNSIRRLLPHGVDNVDVDVQRGGGGNMADDGREGSDIYAVLQGQRGKGVAQIMEHDAPAARPCRYFGQFLLHGGGGQQGVFFFGEGNTGGNGCSAGSPAERRE